MKNYEELTIRDHFMFGKICLKKENSQLILRALFGREINVNDTQAEKFIKKYKDTKFVRLDLLAEEDNGTIYDAELQHKSKNKERQEELPKRMRYYQGMIDTAILSSGTPYRKLPNTYIVFICTYDPFGKGLAKYTLDTNCNEIDIEGYDDGGHKIFFNTTGNLEELTQEAQNMLEYIASGKVSDEATRLLDEEVVIAREIEEWRSEYMLAEVHDLDVFEDGYGSGFDTAFEEGVKKCIDICKKLNQSKDDTVTQLMEEYEFDYADAREKVERYW